MYLPRSWADAPERYRADGVPAEVRFATTLVLARRMLESAFDTAVPAGWVVAGSFSGHPNALRRRLAA